VTYVVIVRQVKTFSCLRSRRHRSSLTRLKKVAEWEEWKARQNQDTQIGSDSTLDNTMEQEPEHSVGQDKEVA
jgi:hypothetical protein